MDHSATILAVDDSEDNLDLIEDALSDENVKLLKARSGTEAMAILMSEPVDLLLLDVMMPDMNGFAVLEMVHFIPRLMNTAAIVLTAHGGRHNAQRVEQLGAKCMMIKPLSPGELVERVRHVLDEATART